MNTGIQDAYNLGWKLALAVQGAAAPGSRPGHHLALRRRRTLPPAWADQLADLLPDPRLRHIDGAGHFLGYAHTEEVLESLLG
jgi:hypothetical protein